MMTHSVNIFVSLFLVTEGYPVHVPENTSKLLAKSSNQTEFGRNEKLQNEHFKDDNSDYIRHMEKLITEDSIDSWKTNSSNSTEREGICLEDYLCNVDGSITLLSGISWSPELLDTHSKLYLDLQLELNNALKTLFLTSYLRSGFEESIIKNVSKKEEGILVDFSLAFYGLPFDVNAEEIENVVMDNLEIIENKTFLGKFNIDEESINFFIDETKIPRWVWGLTSMCLVAILLTTLAGICVKINNLVKKTKIIKSSDLEMTEMIKSLKKSLEEKQSKESKILGEIINSLKTKSTTDKQAKMALSAFVTNYNVYNKMYSKVNMWSVQRVAENNPSLVLDLHVPNLPVNSCCSFCRQG